VFFFRRIAMRKTKKHTVYSIDEKNKIVREYLAGEIGLSACLQKYDIAHRSVLFKWRSQYLAYGTVVDRRGRKKAGGKPKGRPKKVDLKSLSKEELIAIIGVYEDIKKTIAYLRQPKKNITSSLS
jgi:transposase-like protein